MCFWFSPAFFNQIRVKYIVTALGRRKLLECIELVIVYDGNMTTPFFVTGSYQQNLNFPLMTLLITLTLMRGHMSAQMMMAQNATAGDLMTAPQKYAHL